MLDRFASPLVWADAHAHLSSQEMPLDARQLMQQAIELGCQGLVEVATDLPSLERAMALQEQIPCVALAAAITPHDAAQASSEFAAAIKELVEQKRLQAVGETGLDYFHWKESEAAQKRECAWQLEMAAQARLPVIIHCRDAFEDFFSLLDHHYAVEGRWGPGMLHCFTGTRHEAERLIEQGWMISLSGIVTYKKSQDLVAIAQTVPLDQLLIETDSPWLAPQSQRGKINRPTGVLETAACIAAARGMPLEELCQATWANLRRLIRFTGWEAAASAP